VELDPDIGAGAQSLDVDPRRVVCVRQGVEVEAEHLRGQRSQSYSPIARRGYVVVIDNARRGAAWRKGASVAEYPTTKVDRTLEALIPRPQPVIVAEAISFAQRRERSIDRGGRGAELED